MIPPLPPVCAHDVTLPPDPADDGYCPMCLRAALAAARAEVARLRAILASDAGPKACLECFGDGERLALTADGRLVETGACAACHGTGLQKKEENP